MTLADAEPNARVIRVYSVAAKKDLDHGRHNHSKHSDEARLVVWH